MAVYCLSGGAGMGKLLTTDEAAGELRVTVRTVYTWLKEGRLPARKVGKKWLIDSDRIEELLRGEAPAPTDGGR